MSEATAPVPPPEVKVPPTPLQKGAQVKVQCDGYVFEGRLTADDDGGKTVSVATLGTVARTRLV